MAEKILITSGKGGVGKSSISTMLGMALAKLSKRVLLVEMDFGMRCLDILNSVSDAVVYDIGDILEKRCDPLKAIVKSRRAENLFVLCAPTNPDYKADKQNLTSLLNAVAEGFDYVIIDSPAGCGDAIVGVMPLIDRAIIITNPSPISVRDSAIVAQVVHENHIEDTRLIINNVPKRFIPTDMIPDLDAVIDIVGAQLIGVIPKDNTLDNLQFGAQGESEGIKSSYIFSNIARRILGEEINLAIK